MRFLGFEPSFSNSIFHFSFLFLALFNIFIYSCFILVIKFKLILKLTQFFQQWHVSLSLETVLCLIASTRSISFSYAMCLDMSLQNSNLLHHFFSLFSLYLSLSYRGSIKSLDFDLEIYFNICIWRKKKK